MSKASVEPIQQSPTRVLRVTSSTRVSEIDTRATPGFSGKKKDGRALFDERAELLSSLQERLFATGRVGEHRSILLVLQGMDTSGKGGIVRHVLGQVDPQGVSVSSFGVPTDEEKQHDYLWRIRNALPTGGKIKVFDRSHYEDVLVVAVHNLVPEEVWSTRFDEINAFEKEVVDSGTVIVKVAMFVSLAEQKERLLERLDRPDKHWKYNPGDVTERGFWPDYQKAYQRVLDKTDTEYAPWHVLPCDRKWYSRLAVTELLIEALQTLDLSWPTADYDIKTEKRRLAGA